MLISLFAFDFTASATPVLPAINRIDITLRTDIAGKRYRDYKPEEVYSVDTNNMHIPTDWSMPLRIYNEDGDFANRLVAGKTYKIYVYAEKDKNCFYTLNMDVYVNGVKLSKDDFEIMQSDNDVLWINCGKIKITNNKDIFFLSRWFNALFEMFGI